MGRLADVVVINRLPEFQARVKGVLDTALNEAASDILRDAKTNAPYRKGGLRGDSDITMKGTLSRQINFHKEYAGYQERGARADGSHVVRRYTTSGTGAHFLQDAGNSTARRMGMIISKHLGSV